MGILKSRLLFSYSFYCIFDQSLNLHYQKYIENIIAI